MKAAITMQQQYFIDHYSKRENKNMTNFELDAFHFWLRKNHAPMYRRGFKTFQGNGAGEDLHCLLHGNLKKQLPDVTFPCPISQQFAHDREVTLTTDLHGNCTLDFCKGRLHFLSFLTLLSPWEFYLEKVLERSQIEPGSDAFVPVLECSGPWTSCRIVLQTGARYLRQCQHQWLPNLLLYTWAMPFLSCISPPPAFKSFLLLHTLEKKSEVSEGRRVSLESSRESLVIQAEELPYEKQLV